MAERTCILSGKSLPRDRLIRFVAGPEGHAVFDLAEKLPGRGAWIELSAESLRRADDRKLLNRRIGVGSLTQKPTSNRSPECCACGPCPPPAWRDGPDALLAGRENWLPSRPALSGCLPRRTPRSGNSGACPRGLPSIGQAAVWTPGNLAGSLAVTVLPLSAFVLAGRRNWRRHSALS